MYSRRIASTGKKRGRERERKRERERERRERERHRQLNRLNQIGGEKTLLSIPLPLLPPLSLTHCLPPVGSRWISVYIYIYIYIYIVLLLLLIILIMIVYHVTACQPADVCTWCLQPWCLHMVLASKTAKYIKTYTHKFKVFPALKLLKVSAPSQIK